MSNRETRRATKKEPVVRANVDRRAFSYTKGIVSLNFSLRIDVPEELEAFKEMAEMAIEDINEALENMKK